MSSGSGSPEIDSNRAVLDSSWDDDDSVKVPEGSFEIEAAGEDFVATSVDSSDDLVDDESGIGLMIWSGELAKGELLTIDGGRASSGTLEGRLPGTPVTLDIDGADFDIIELPAPDNGWERIRIRSRNAQNGEIVIPWFIRE
jgi:hypothetical protein